MVKQVVIQLQDFTSDVCDAPLPAEEQTSFGIKTVKQVRNHLNIEDYQLTNEMAKQAFIQFVAKQSCCCLDKSYSNNLRILNIEYSFVFVVTFESFVERRQTCYSFKPDSEEPVENEEEIPPIWKIKTEYDNSIIPFVDHDETTVVPNSSVVKNCNKCNGKTRRTCPTCLGIQVSEKICKQCNNSNFIKCEVCTNGKLNWFQLLKVSWRNNKDVRYVSKHSLIPEDKLKLVEGLSVFEETGKRASPLNFVDGDTTLADQVTQECGRLISSHEDNYHTAKLIEQRQEIRAICTALVHYQYGKRKLGKFSLYYDRVEDLKVHAASFSKNCCAIL